VSLMIQGGHTVVEVAKPRSTDCGGW
jgi:hypothetical protein